jgi:hypothetical protein
VFAHGSTEYDTLFPSLLYCTLVVTKPLLHEIEQYL